MILGGVSASDDEPSSDEDVEYPSSKDQPYLRFEIKSDDGFSVEADSIEGELFLTCLVTHTSLILKSLYKFFHKIFICLQLLGKLS